MKTFKSERPRAVKAYLAWFQPDSEDKLPAEYRVYISLSPEQERLFHVTVIATNTDTPEPEEQMSWCWASHSDIEVFSNE